jgi:hypothetical protein
MVEERLAELSVADHKRLLDERGVEYSDVLEKPELTARLQTALRRSEMALSSDERRTIGLFKKCAPSVVHSTGVRSTVRFVALPCRGRYG